MPTATIEIDEYVTSDLDAMAHVDGDWDGDDILGVLEHPTGVRQGYVATIDDRQVVGYMIIEHVMSWLVIHRLRSLVSDAALEKLIQATKRCALRCVVECVGVLIQIEERDNGGNDLLRRLGFRAKEVLRDEDGHVLSVVMMWDIEEQ